jgi:hypothetical protein
MIIFKLIYWMLKILYWIFVILYRFWAGRMMWGPPRTDCTYLRAGTRSLIPNRIASYWQHLPGRKRQRVRLVFTIPAMAVIGLWYVDYVNTLIVFSVTVVGLYILWMVRHIRHMRVHRQLIQPLAFALSEHLQQDPRSPAGWIYVPASLHGMGRRSLSDLVSLPGWTTRGHRVGRALWRTGRVLSAPVRWRRAFLARERGAPARGHEYGWVAWPFRLVATDAFKKTISIALHDKLPGDWVFDWKTKGSHPHVRFRPKPRPPDWVGFNDIEHALGHEGKLVIGNSAKGVEVINLDDETPHIGVSCGTGAGKSTFVSGLIAQVLHEGGQVYVIDPKRISLLWCRDLPGVTYAKTPDEMHDAWVKVGAECLRRFEREDRGEDVGPRLLVVAEEMNMASDILRNYWTEIREKDDPKKSPAQSGMGTIAFAGRQIRVNGVFVAQRLDAKITGGGDVRENIGSRLMGRASVQAWRMMAPECGPKFPAKSLHRGRMYLVRDGYPTEIQAAYWSEDQLKAYARDGELRVPADWDALVKRSSTGNSVPELRDKHRTVSLRQFAEIISERTGRTVSYDAVRQYRVRHSDFPDALPSGQWRLSDLIAWADSVMVDRTDE